MHLTAFLLFSTDYLSFSSLYHYKINNCLQPTENRSSEFFVLFRVICSTCEKKTEISSFFSLALVSIGGAPALQGVAIAPPKKNLGVQ
jgi:hypothetical protein